MYICVYVYVYIVIYIYIYIYTYKYINMPLRDRANTTAQYKEFVTLHACQGMVYLRRVKW